MITEVKKCKRCGTRKPLKEFYGWLDKTTHKFRRQTICKQCRAVVYYNKPDPLGESWITKNVPWHKEV